MSFNITRIDEPELEFREGTSKDPRAGLVKHGPRTPSNRSVHKVINVGIIGSAKTISGVERLFVDMRNTIFPEDLDEKGMKRWKPPFPGTGENSPLDFSICTKKEWREPFTPEELEEITKIDSIDGRVEAALSKVREKIKIIYGRESPPDIVIVSIPEELNDACTSSDEKKPKIQGSNTDFHNRIKLQGIDIGIPTQLIRPETLRGEGTQDKSHVAWNLGVGLYYKARQGHPWKMTELEEGTCYVGISFYEERSNANIRPAMAQVFLDTGESFILRGDPLGSSENNRKSFMNKEEAYQLISSVLKQYNDYRKRDPQRLVVHKTSNFRSEEREGIKEAAENIDYFDLITIRGDHPIRFFGPRDYPILRGSLICPPGEREYYLYTKGYIPALGTYPGPRVPKPLVIQPDEELCHSSIEKISEEILAFTKLDWNTSHFCRKFPVTIEVSKSVGSILAEAKAQDIEIDPHYYFYM